MIAKGSKIRTGQPPPVENNKRVHMPVGRVVIVDRSDKLDGRAVALFEFEHRGNSEVS